MFEAWIMRGVGQGLDAVHRFLKVNEDAHVIFYQLGGETDGILRGDGAVGPHFDHQFFVVRHLAQASGFDGVVHLAYRRVNAVHGDVADRQVFVVVGVRSHVATAVLDAHFDLQAAAFADRSDIDILVEHGEVGVFFDLGRSDWSGMLEVQIDGLGQVGVELNGDLLQVTNDVRGVFYYAGDRGEFVQYPFDLDGGDGRALDGAQQRATQRVAHCRAPTALKRLRGKSPVLFGERFEFRGETLWFLKALPHRGPSFRGWRRPQYR